MLNRSLLSLSLVLLSASACLAQGISWTTDLPAARKAAADQRRLILLHFFSDDCPPCEKLEATVFPTPEVVDACNRNYIPVKVYVKQAQALCQQYQITRWPTDVIVTPNGQEVFRSISPGNPKEYSLMLSQVALQAGVGAGRTDTGYTSNAIPAIPSANDALAQAHAVAAGAQQQLQQSAAGLQQQAEQQGNQWQQQAAQLQQQGQQQWNTGVDRITQAATLPSLLPQRRSTYAADNVVTSAPQPGRITEGTTDVPRPETIYGNAAPGTGAAQYVPPTVPSGQQVAHSEPAAAGGPLPNNLPPRPANRYPQPGQEYGAAAPRGQQPWVNPITGQQPAGPPGPQYQSNPYVTANSPETQPQVQPQPQPQPQVQPQPQPQFQPQPQPQQPLASVPVVNAPPAPPATALDGYCPVTLLETKKWKKADPKWGAIHRGRTYLFTSPESQQKFLADPDRFAPILAGHDPVRYSDNGELVSGVRKHGIMYRNQIFLFADEASLTKFTQAPDRYSSTAFQAMAQADPTLRR